MLKSFAHYQAPYECDSIVVMGFGVTDIVKCLEEGFRRKKKLEEE